MRKRTTILILAIAVAMLASCSNQIRMTFDVPERFQGTYVQGGDILEIRQNNIIINGMGFEEYISGIIGSVARITDFSQASTQNNYSFTFVATATSQGITASAVFTFSAVLSGDGNSITCSMTSTTGASVNLGTFTRAE